MKKWTMLASCWSGSSWLSHYHKGLTHHSDDCTSGEVGQDQIQTIKKYKYKLQKTQIQTTKKTNTNYKKTKKTKPQRYARIWINNKKRSLTSQFSCPLFGLFGIVQINGKICKLENTTAPTLFTTM